jgi:glucuronoarabinoxylan endo-1,4-beta-xylanase
MNSGLKRTAILPLLFSLSFWAFCKNKVADPSKNGGSGVNPDDFIGIYSETFPWRFAQTGDHEPMLLRYYAGGGLTFENGTVLDSHYSADKTEGKECIRFTVPVRGGNDGAFQNLQSYLLFRTFTSNKPNAAGAVTVPIPPMNWSATPYFAMKVKGPRGFKGRIGMNLASQHPDYQDPNDSHHPEQALLFPQDVTDQWTQVFLDVRRFTDLDPTRIIRYSIQFQNTQEGKPFLIDDIVLAKNRPAGPDGDGGRTGTDDETFSATVALKTDGSEKQTIDGFGFFGGTPRPEWLITEMGTSMVRTEIPSEFEPSNENGDANVLDPARFNRSALAGSLEILRSYRALLPELKVIASVWSPPGWMKVNGSVGGGDKDPSRNKLRPDMRAEFAEYCAAYARALKEEGIPLYGLSLQNEMYFSQDFASCQYTSAEMTDLIKIVGARFDAEEAKGDGFIRPVLFAPEHVLGDWFLTEINNFITLTGRDADANRYTGIIALHAYTENATNPADIPNTLWGRARASADKIGKPLWMTETSGFEVSLNGALEMVEGVYTSLVYGNVRAWVHFSAEGAFVQFSERTDLFFAAKQFFRFIRPGAKRIDAAADGSSDALPVCFRNADGSVAIVVINKGAAGLGLDLKTFRNLGKDVFTVYRTSANNQCKRMGEKGIDDVVPLVARSVTTLYSGPPMPGTE